MNILEGREKTKETNDKFTEKLSEGERLQEEGEESDRILAGVELDGLDSDTQSAGREVVQNFSEVYNSAIEEVSDQVDSVADTAKGHVESLGENREQVDRNAERYAEAAGVSDLGRGAADAGKAKMESDSQAYSELISENERAIDEALEETRTTKSAINSLFKG